MNSIGTPWLTTLKNPKSSQALTMEFLASGSERSIMGIPLKKVVGGLHVLIKENWSNAGRERTTMVAVCF